MSWTLPWHAAFKRLPVGSHLNYTCSLFEPSHHGWALIFPRIHTSTPRGHTLSPWPPVIGGPGPGPWSLQRRNVKSGSRGDASAFAATLMWRSTRRAVSAPARLRAARGQRSQLVPYPKMRSAPGPRCLRVSRPARFGFSAAQCACNVSRDALPRGSPWRDVIKCEMWCE